MLALMANSNYRRYMRAFSLGGEARAVRGNADPAVAQKLKDRVGACKTVSIVSFSVAAAAAIGGTALFLFAPEWQAAKTVQAGVMPMEGGAIVSLQGFLP
jgi:hypothetical protein